MLAPIHRLSSHSSSIALNHIPIEHGYNLNFHSRSMPRIALLPTDYYPRQLFGPICRIRGPRLRSPPPTSLHSLLYTYCFTFSREPAIFHTYHLPQVSGIIRALSATLVCVVVSLISFLCFFGKDVVLPINICCFLWPHNAHHLQVTVSGYCYFNDVTLL